MNNDALYAAAIAGNADAISELEAKADKLDRSDRTILHNESGNGNTERVRFLVNKLANKNILLKLDGMKQTALHFGACYGHTQVVEVLIDAATHLPSSSSNRVSSFQAFIRQVNADGATALSNAVNKDYMDIVKLLVEADPGDRHIQNGEGKTPIYVAAEKGYNGIVKLICATCTNLSLDGPDGSTALHAAILNFHKAKEEDRDVMTVIINAAKRSSSSHFEALFNRTDESGCTVLELAVKKNYVNMVKLILAEDPACQRGRVPEKHALMCLIYKAIDTGYKDIVKLLCRTYEAGITTGHRGVVSVILAIKRCDKASVLRLLIDNIHFDEIIADQVQIKIALDDVQTESPS
ncbi:hypothetical protein POM88_019806 [Heracleum sosnowskyi]|uniref:Ankyrin repeat protein n=1 Tax=Heracleum sosnowskyi TaxID=360622 RepID=A0AAD8IAM5_9APIA|nr:hypothetical protein POM88_019806 [Heracleum sosnowskyi]